MIHIPVAPDPFFALLQKKFVVVANSYSRRRFSAAFTSRTKPDRTPTTSFQATKLLLKCQCFPFYACYFAMFLNEQSCGDEKMSLQVKRNINTSKTIEDTKTFKLYLHFPAFL